MNAHYREPTIQFHKLLTRNTMIPVVIIDVVAGIYTSLRCLLGLDIFANKVAEPAVSSVSGPVCRIGCYRGNYLLVVEIIHGGLCKV